jgi:putative multiple sugar transport system substrate-binding protein
MNRTPFRLSMSLMIIVATTSLIFAACSPTGPQTVTLTAMTPAPTAPAPALPTTLHLTPTTPPTVDFSGKVGIVFPSDRYRWPQDAAAFRKTLTGAGANNVEILFTNGDSATEKKNVESLINKGVKVIIITPVDASAAAAVEEAHQSGVKVISYDSLIRDTPAVDYYVTFDNIAVGEAFGQYLIDQAKGTGNNLYLYAGSPADNNTFMFFEGVWNKLQPKIADGTFIIKNSREAVALKDKPKLTRDEMDKIIGNITTQWDPDVAARLAGSNLRTASPADKGTVYIVAPNDFTARAIADAFAADKDVKQYFITGQDAEKESVQYILDGKQSMTVFKDVRTLAVDAVATANTLLAGGTPTQTTTINNGKLDVPTKLSTIVTVTKDNVKSALIDSGYYQASDFTGLP